MRNAQKTALMALFAAMDDSADTDERVASAAREKPPGPRTERPIAIDPLWLATRQLKGRA